MKPFFEFAFLASLVLSACAVSAQPPEPVFRATLKNEADQVAFENQDGTTFVDIQSPSGIGSARLDLQSGTMPEKIIVNLHLAGLEEFRLSSEKITIAASFSSEGVITGNSQRIVSSDKETPITPNHPYWLNIRRVTDQLTPKIPPGGEYFEVEVPKQLLDELGNSFEILWIDFYR
jgi:hypothetical protein